MRKKAMAKLRGEREGQRKTSIERELRKEIDKLTRSKGKRVQRRQVSVGREP